jgi:hypothetical protein
MGNHYFITWDYHVTFELWGVGLKGGFNLIKDFTYPRVDYGMTYDDATIYGEELFEEWLKSLDTDDDK